VLHSDQLAQTQFGTPLYMAPEMHAGMLYTNKVDLWSVGCVTFEMLTGKTPYQSPTLDKLYQKLKQPLKYPKHISAPMLELLQGLLRKDPTRRFSLEQFLHHPVVDAATQLELPQSPSSLSLLAEPVELLTPTTVDDEFDDSPVVIDRVLSTVSEDADYKPSALNWSTALRLVRRAAAAMTTKPVFGNIFRQPPAGSALRGEWNQVLEAARRGEVDSDVVLRAIDSGEANVIATIVIEVLPQLPSRPLVSSLVGSLIEIVQAPNDAQAKAVEAHEALVSYLEPPSDRARLVITLLEYLDAVVRRGATSSPASVSVSNIALVFVPLLMDVPGPAAKLLDNVDGAADVMTFLIKSVESLESLAPKLSDGWLSDPPLSRPDGHQTLSPSNPRHDERPKGRKREKSLDAMVELDCACFGAVVHLGDRIADETPCDALSLYLFVLQQLKPKLQDSSDHGGLLADLFAAVLSKAQVVGQTASRFYPDTTPSVAEALMFETAVQSV